MVTSLSKPEERQEYIENYCRELREEDAREKNAIRNRLCNNAMTPVHEVKAQGRLIEVITSAPPGIIKKGAKGGGQRKEITEFSQKSRSRLLKDMNRIDREEVKHPVFLTLTYGQHWPDIKQSKNHIRRFNQELKRKCLTACGWWRMEPQERGAPHYHLVVLGLPRYDRGGLSKGDVAALWGRIIGKQYWDRKNDRAPFTRIECLDSWKKVTNYVCKYVAKVAKPADAGSGFNTVPYRHSETGEEVEMIGRQWGRFNAKALPYAVIEVISTHSMDVFYRMRRLFSKLYEPIKDKNWSYHVYAENPGQILRFIEREMIT